jgi:hypothetical protein
VHGISAEFGRKRRPENTDQSSPPTRQELFSDSGPWADLAAVRLLLFGQCALPEGMFLRRNCRNGEDDGAVILPSRKSSPTISPSVACC